MSRLKSSERTAENHEGPIMDFPAFRLDSHRVVLTLICSRPARLDRVLD